MSHRSGVAADKIGAVRNFIEGDQRDQHLTIHKIVLKVDIMFKHSSGNILTSIKSVLVRSEFVGRRSKNSRLQISKRVVSRFWHEGKERALLHSGIKRGELEVAKE